MEVPESKRQRMGSVPDSSWENGHHYRTTLPPPLSGAQSPHSHSHSQPPPYTHARPTSSSHQHPYHIDNRRHPTQEYASPTYERGGIPNGGNAYITYNGHGEPLRKIDSPGDPTLLVHQRPNSTGQINDGHLLPLDDDPRRHENTQNIPPGYRTQQYISHQVQPLHTVYEPGPGGYPPPVPHSDIYHRQPFAGESPVNAPKPRKQPRTSQACVQCRTAKAKCDDPKPCSACRKAGHQCDFKPAEPKQADKIQQDILNTLLQLKGGMSDINGRMSDMEKRLADSKIKSGEVEIVSPERNEISRAETMDISPTVPNGLLVEGHLIPEFHAQETEYEADYQADIEEEQSIVHPDQKTNLTIPSQHTTPASRMLTWPSIQKHIGAFVKNDPTIRDFHYTTTREGRRGVLRLYGRGEGSDGMHLSGRSVRDQHGDFDDTGSETSASPAADGVWGLSGSFTPQMTPSSSMTIEERTKASDPWSTPLELNERKIRQLAKSYMRHMNAMHPIIFPGFLDKLIINFLRSMPKQDISRDRAKSGKRATSAFVEMGRPLTVKRKYSHVEEGNVLPPNQIKTGNLPRSIDTALLLLILALGQLCEHRSKIPNCITPEHESSYSSFNSGNVDTSFTTQSASHPSPSHNQSPAASPQATFTPSPMEADRPRSFGFAGHRRSSCDSTSAYDRHRQCLPCIRNMDVIPGLAYFAAATDIIGNQLGGNTLQHVQVNILASLYHGQLARVAESHAYLWQASRAVQAMILERSGRYKDMKAKNLSGEKKDTSLLIAFWTCLQLESDLVAELDFPHTGILKWEDSVPWPQNQFIAEAGIPYPQIESYSSQLYLRQILNRMHNRLYSIGNEADYRLPINEKVLQQLITDCESWAKDIITTNRLSRLSNDDPETIRLLDERLRAKQFGAKNITYRPFLMMIMNRPPDYPVEDIPAKVRENALLCIYAMENSTKCFDMVDGKRTIITNPWGTAHAQWGNVIALQAAYMDPFFRNLGAISTHTLTTLIKKTLDFLHNIAQPSSSIWQDIKILLHMAKNVTQLLPTEYTIPDQPSSRSNGDIHNYSSRYEDSNGQGTRPRAMTMH